MRESKVSSYFRQSFSPSLHAGLIIVTAIVATFLFLFISGTSADAQDADLVITDLFFTDDVCYDGDYMDTPINVTVENRGLEDATDVEVGFYLMPGENYLGSANVGDLAQSESGNATFQWNSLGKLGDRIIMGHADHNDMVEEVNESNNQENLTSVDWMVITGTGPAVQYSDVTITLGGSLTIAGELDLFNCDLFINSTPGEDPLELTVDEYSVYKGFLDAEDTLFAAGHTVAAPYIFKVERYCGLILESCVVTDLYTDPDSGKGGLEIVADGAGIYNSTIASGGGYGLWARGEIDIRSTDIMDSGFVAYHLVQEGNFVYTSSPYGGITIVDVTLAFSPSEIGRFRLPLRETVGGYGTLELMGTELVAAVGSGGVMVVNISDPANPWLTGRLELPGTRIDDISLFSLNGTDYCSAVGSDGTLYLVNISDPANPLLLSDLELDTERQLQWVDAENDGNRVAGCIAAGDMLYFIDLDDPGTPVLESSMNASVLGLDSLDVTGGVLVAGEMAFVGTDSAILTLNITNLSSPSLIQETDTPATVMGLSMSVDQLAAAYGSTGIGIYEPENDGSLTLYTDFDTLGRSAAVFHNRIQNRTYVADSEEGLRLIHIRNPSAQFTYELGAYELQGTGMEVVHGGYVTVRDSLLSDHLLVNSRGGASTVAVYTTRLEGHSAARLENGSHIFSNCTIGTHTQGIVSWEEPVLYLENITIEGLTGTAVSSVGGYVLVKHVLVKDASTGILLQEGSAALENYSTSLDDSQAYGAKFYDCQVTMMGGAIDGGFRGIFFSSDEPRLAVNLTGVDISNTSVALYLRGGTINLDDCTVTDSVRGIDSGDSNIVCNDVLFSGNEIAIVAVETNLSFSGTRIDNSSIGVDMEGGVLNGFMSEILAATGIRAENSTLDMRNCSLEGAKTVNLSGEESLATFLNVHFDGEVETLDHAGLLVEYTLDLHILDKHNDDFTGVDIDISDAFGTDVYSGTTDAQGNRKGMKLRRAYYQEGDDVVFTPHDVNLSYSNQFQVFPVDMNMARNIEYSFEIYEIPLPVLNVTNVSTTNYDVRFDATGSYDNDGEVKRYYFDFGDGSVKEWTLNPNEEHKYNQGDIYTVRLKVRDDEGYESDWLEKTLTINDAPFATISGSSTIRVTTDEPFHLDGSTSRDPNEDHPSQDYITAYRWNMSNGDYFDTQQIDYVYYEEGDYNVRLKVWDSFGKSNEVTITVKVDENEEPNAVIETGDSNYTYESEGHLITFDGEDSRDPNEKELYFYWDFDDGTTMEGEGEDIETVDHWFYDAGEYNVTLTVTDRGGLSHTTNVTVNIIRTAGSLSVQSSVLETDSRNVDLEFMITNTGSHREHYEVRFLKPTNYRINNMKDLEKINLNSSEIETVNRSMSIPALEAGDYPFTIELYSTRNDEDGTLEDSLAMTVRVLPEYEVGLTVKDANLESKAGKRVEFTFTITNIGNSDDRFEITLEDLPRDWEAIVSGNAYPYTPPDILGPETDLEFSLEVEVPDDAVPEIYSITVLVTSLSDEDMSESKTVKVSVIEGEGDDDDDDKGGIELTHIAGGFGALIIVLFILAKISGSKKAAAEAAREKSAERKAAQRKPEKVRVTARKGAENIPCPRCGSDIPVTSKERPLKIKCPECDATGTIK